MIRIREFLAYSILGSVIYSAFDGGQIIAKAGLSHDISSQLVLLSCCIFLGALIGVLFSILFSFLRIPRNQKPYGAFIFSILGMITLSLTENLFRDPPPFMASNLPVSIGLPLILVLDIMIFIILIQWAQRPRQKAGVVLLSAFIMAGVINSNRRLPEQKGTPLPDAPNVLLVSLDTARFDHFQANEKSDILTPNFDDLAVSGVRFSNAYAPIAVTGPSHLSLLSGLGPWDHGLLLNGRPIPDAPVLMAEQFSKIGYRTGAFVSAPVLDGALGFDRGFDVYDDHFGWIVGFPETIWGRLWSSLQRRQNPHHVLERRAQRTVDQALIWLDDGDDRPFFSWVHLFDPHGPYQPPPPWDTQYYQGDDPYDPAQVSMQEVDGVAAYLKQDLEGVTDVQWPLSQYAGEVSYTDAQLGRLVEWLETKDLRNETLVVVTGDHGESLGDGGVWFNHGGQLNPAELHIPLVMSWPTILPQSTEVGAFVEISDILPTLFEAIVQKPPETSKGLSLMTAIYTDSHREYARGICYDRKANLAQRALDPDFKPTFRMSALQTIEGTYTLYEHNDVLGMPDGVDSVQINYSDVLRETLSLDLDTLNSINPDVNQETRQRLEALGYME